MQRKKTRAELLAQQYLSKSDIRHLLMMPWATATHVYQKAQELDDKTLKFRVYETRVRTSSVLKVTGLSYSLLERQIKGEISNENNNEN